MKILHTADWHLGDRLGRIDRTDDLRKAVERIAGYCKQQGVDVLLVAGDLFSELARPDGLRETIRHWQDVFREFLETGGTILTLTGNHDNENFCQTLVHAMTLAAPTVGTRRRSRSRPAGSTSPPTPRSSASRTAAAATTCSSCSCRTPRRAVTFKRRSDAELRQPRREERPARRCVEDALVATFARHRITTRRRPPFSSAHINVHGSQIGAEPVPHHAAGRRRGRRHGPAPSSSTTSRSGTSTSRRRLGSDARPLLRQHRADGPRRAGRPEGRRPRRDRPGWARTANRSVLPLPATADLRSERFSTRRRTCRGCGANTRTPQTDLVNLHMHYTAGVDQLEDVLRELDRHLPAVVCPRLAGDRALGPTLVGPDGPRTRASAKPSATTSSRN